MVIWVHTFTRCIDIRLSRIIFERWKSGQAENGKCGSICELRAELPQLDRGTVGLVEIFKNTVCMMIYLARCILSFALSECVNV